MKLKHIIDEVSVDVIRTAEIRKLLKEYDALDGVLLESNDTRDVKIVVRLDELGLFDSMLSEKKSREQRKAERAAEITANKNKKIQNRTPKDTPEELPEPSVDTQPDTSPEAIKGPGSIRKLGSMLASALKSGKSKLVTKIKTVINKIRGKAPDAPLTDISEIPPDVATSADKFTFPSYRSSRRRSGRSGGKFTDSTPTSVSTATPADEPTVDTPSTEKPSAATSPEETPAKDEPLVSPDTVSKLQRNARITPSTPAPVDTPTGDTATPVDLKGPKPPHTPEQQAAFDKFQKEKQATVTNPTDSPVKSDKPKEEPATEPTAPKFGTPEWTAMRKQQLAAMSPEDKAKESEKALKRVGFTQTGTSGRGIRDRIGAAWKGLTAKAGEDLGKAGTKEPKYRSMFYEIAKKLHKIGVLENKFALHEWSRVFETAGYGPLGEYAQYLSENTMDEERYNLRELYAMMEEMQQLEQAHNWWQTPSEAEKDGHRTPHEVHEQSLYDNEDLEERYTLEEFMGMMEETYGKEHFDRIFMQGILQDKGITGVDPYHPLGQAYLSGNDSLIRQARSTAAPKPPESPKTENSSFSLEEILDEMED